MEYIKNNYFRSYGSGDTFRCEIDPPKDKTIKFHDASTALAHEIYAKKQGKIYLLYSGGIDSEYILNLFLSLNMDITPVIVRLNPNYNLHDIQYAINFCESKNLKPIIYDIDFDDFVKSGKILDVAQSCQCGAFELPPIFHAISQLDGTIITGNHGSPYITKFNRPNGAWVIEEEQQIHSVLKYFINNKIIGHPFFLVNTAEQYHSLLIQPSNIALVSNEYTGWQNNEFIKCKMYNELSGFNMIIRPKFTGFENIKNSGIFQHENLQWFETDPQKWRSVCSLNYFDIVNQ